MKKILPLVLLGLCACGLIPKPPPTLTPVSLPTQTATGIPTAPMPTAALGTAQNPLILALAPSARADENALNASKVLISQLEKSSGYHFVTIAPATESDLINRFRNGNAHIAVLSPFGYLLLSQDGSASAAFARQQDGSAFYGAEFIVRSDAGFFSYFDPVKNENTAEASAALMQLQGRKPCWSDSFSPSSYVVPLGFLKEAGVATCSVADPAHHPARGAGLCRKHDRRYAARIDTRLRGCLEHGGWKFRHANTLRNQCDAGGTGWRLSGLSQGGEGVGYSP